jgi:transcriptional antiterminator
LAFQEELDQHIRIGLADHIAFSLKRLKDGIEVANPFLAETRTLYNQEYRLAEKLAKIIEKNFDCQVPDSEKGYLAMHLHRLKRDLNI